MTKRRLETDLAEQQKARTAPARHLVALTLAWSIAAWSVAASSTIAIFAFTISPVQADEKKAAEGKPGQAGDAP
ncbi:MAG TPA: hypothetical protein V6C72_08350, partial [Chroococcales cyanobacterium]